MPSPAIVVLFILYTLTFINTASYSKQNKDSLLKNIPFGNIRENKHNTLDENNAELYEHVVNNIFDDFYEENEEINDNLDISGRHHKEIAVNVEVDEFTVRKIDKNKEKNNIDNTQSIHVRNHEEIDKNLDVSVRNYEENGDINKNLIKHKSNERNIHTAVTFRDFNESVAKVRVKRDDDPRCEAFMLSDGKIQHPHAKNGSTYYNNTNCVYVISDPASRIIELTFVDVFSIEDHPSCAYDYLEIRDGLNGYSKLLGKFCGHSFPPQLTSTGPDVWLKFHSDDTIEHEGFHISIKFKEAVGQSIPDSCFKTIESRSGVIDTENIDPMCKSGSQNLEVLWTIQTPENTKIYLNFTKYVLLKPNDCEENVIEVFGYVLEASARLAKYCGSVAEAISTKIDKKKNISNVNTNTMHVRLYASKLVKEKTVFSAKFTAFRTLNTAEKEKCDPEDEFDCDDNTCIDLNLICDSYADCRLKTDEDPDSCKTVTTSAISQPQTLYILIVFSLMISAIFFVIIFKCIRKLYNDHKVIKQHQQESLEQRLNSLVERRLTLDAQKMRESEPRASLERENRTNEMFKKKRDSFSKRKLTSIESDLNQKSLIDLDVELWRREVETHPVAPEDARRQRETPDRKGRGRRIETLQEEGSKEETDKKKESKETQDGVDKEDVRKDRKGRPKRTETHKEESRSKRETEKQEMEHVPFGVLDTKESGCQTRDSLFQNVPPSSSDGSGTTTSGVTIASPPATSTAEITIELPKQAPRQETKPQKKTESRPISTETTRSAPDVIILVKPM